MVTNGKEHTQKTPGKQAPDVVIPKPIKIGASTPYDFQGSNMTAYGGLLPVVTMLEKLQFQELIEQHVTIKRLTTSMPGFRFVLAMILALYVGFSRLNHLQFLGREPMLTGILEVGELPVQSTFWRFLASLHLVVARQLLEVGQQMRQRVWAAAHVGLKEVTLETDTTGQTPVRLVEELQALRWTGSPRNDAAGQSEYRYQQEGWRRPYRFVVLRYGKKPKPNKLNDPDQSHLFDPPHYSYRVFVTNLDAP